MNTKSQIKTNQKQKIGSRSRANSPVIIGFRTGLTRSSAVATARGDRWRAELSDGWGGDQVCKWWTRNWRLGGRGGGVVPQY